LPLQSASTESTAAHAFPRPSDFAPIAQTPEHVVGDGEQRRFRHRAEEVDHEP